MGYYKNLEIGSAVEEADRYISRRGRRRRETYQRPRRTWTVESNDIMLFIFALVCSFALGAVLGYALGGGLDV